MLFLNKMHIILGLQLVVLINLSQSFVLLTANMEDVRKLAKKFVSESLAEQIADFIAKVSSNSVVNIANVSEENERNAVNLYRQMSSEDDSRNNKIVIQRSPKKFKPQEPQTTETQATEYVEVTTEKNIESNYIKQSKKIKLSKNKRTKDKKQSSKNRPDTYRLSDSQFDMNNNNNEDVKTEPELKEKYRPEISAEVEPVQQKPEVTIKTTKHRKKPRKPLDELSSPSIGINLDSTIGYAEKYEFDDNPSPNQHKIYPKSSEELNETYDTTKFNDYDAATTNASEITSKYVGFNIERSEHDLTTKKEKNEFDQYDNKHYPKSEFVATSGPVSLPKLPPQWWEKDITDIKKPKEFGKKRKAWF